MLSVALNLHDSQMPVYRDEALRARRAASARKRDYKRAFEHSRKYRNSAGVFPKRPLSWFDVVICHAPFTERVKATMLNRSIISVQRCKQIFKWRGIKIRKRDIVLAMQNKLPYGDLSWQSVMKKRGVTDWPSPQDNRSQKLGYVAMKKKALK